MKRVIFTTVQNNYEAIKMLELALKSFYAFNSGFDFKVFCLDNSKDKFKEYFDKDYFRLNEWIMTTSMKFDLNKVYDVYHFACTFSKPFYEFNKERVHFENNFVLPIRNFYSNLFKLFDVDVDFINKPTKFTTSAVAINRCYNMRLRYIKSNYVRALKK